MKKFLFILGTCFALNSSLSAMLPPLWQGIAEMQAVLADPLLGEILSSGEYIVFMQKTEDGYLIFTNHHWLIANIISEESGVGPQKFYVQFEAPNPIFTQ